MNYWEILMLFCRRSPTGVWQMDDLVRNRRLMGFVSKMDRNVLTGRACMGCPPDGPEDLLLHRLNDTLLHREDKGGILYPAAYLYNLLQRNCTGSPTQWGHDPSGEQSHLARHGNPLVRLA